MTENWEYKAGQLISGIIFSLFEVIALAEDMPLQDVVDEWVSSYVTGRIIREADSNGGSE